MCALVGDALDVAAVVAFHFALALVVGHGDGAILALQRLAAGTAKDHGRISAAVEEHHDLLFFFEALANFFGQFARDHLLLACLLKFLPHVDTLDFGQRTLLDAIGQFDQGILMFLRVVIGFERWRGRTEDYYRCRHFRSHHCHIARVVTWRLLLLVRRILLLVDDDQSEIADRGKHSRPRACHDSRLATANAMPLFGALRIRQPGMQDGNLVAEHLMKVGGDRRSQANFRNEQDRGAALLQHLAHAREIDRRLSRAGDAM